MSRLLATAGILLIALTAGCQSGTDAPDPVATSLAYVAGSQQHGTVGSVLADSLVVRVLDQNGKGMAGVVVQFATSAGGGGNASPGQATTTVDGYARAAWTLGTKPGDHTASAVAAGLREVTFTASAATRPASRLEKVGDAQTATVGTSPAAPLAVKATDEFQNPVAGVSVTWSVNSGGGSITPVSATTGADGLASATWVLGTRTGPNTATASGAGTAAAFLATGTPGPVATLVKVDGDAQTVTAGNAEAIGERECTTAKPLPNALRVRALDAYGNGVDGLAVTWQAPFGNLSTATSTTNGAGEATTTWSLVAQMGRYSATASVPTGVSVVFGATVLPGRAHSILKVSGDNQTGRVQVPLSLPLVVRVVDFCGNGISGIGVLWGGNVQFSDFSPRTSLTSPTGHTQSTWTPASDGDQYPGMVKLVDPAFDLIQAVFRANVTR